MSTTTKLLIAATLLAFAVLHLIGDNITHAAIGTPAASVATLDGD